jgi:hypothetical protein
MLQGLKQIHDQQRHGLFHSFIKNMAFHEWWRRDNGMEILSCLVQTVKITLQSKAVISTESTIYIKA